MVRWLAIHSPSTVKKMLVWSDQKMKGWERKNPTFSRSV
jgi:hypothetical protein